MEQLLPYLLIVPLLGSVASYLISLKSPKFSGIVATGAVVITAILSGYLFRNLTGELRFSLWEWFSVYGESLPIELCFDRLSAVMCLVVTWVGAIIHLYSFGYMKGDDSQGRFFAYMNLFIFSMLILVLGGSLPVMFVGWEGVGLCSYLLIGFWFQNQEYAKAGQKAFIVNRIGDAGFLLGILILVQQGLSLTFSELRGEVHQVAPEAITAAAIFLFLGAAGKSAQIPLFTWLPDAMAGPTPVSALIHAATMVTAGVYLFARMDFLLEVAPTARILILIAGALTALIGASSALVQKDIKKVLAYSTVSQLGFMFMALGVGASNVAIFHVVTHAFFKALLFLSAGSVIVGCHHEQLLENFGGLRKKMPVTFLCYLIGTLAIAGVPFLSGAYSKDLILERVYSPESFSGLSLFGLGRFAWAVGVFSAGLTAFYMFRSLILTFFGKYRGHAEVHESGPLILIPLLLLAVPALAFGALYGENLLAYLGQWSGNYATTTAEEHHLLETIVLIFSGIGIALAITFYGFFSPLRDRVHQLLPNIREFLTKAWGFDELYELLFVRSLNWISLKLAGLIDRGVIDGIVNSVGVVTEASAELTRRSHNGRIPQFIATMLSSFVFFLVFLFLLR